MDELTKFVKSTRPSQSAYILEGLLFTLDDLLQDASATDISQRDLIKLHALASAASGYASSLAHWFSSRMGRDHELLEVLQDE